MVHGRPWWVSPGPASERRGQARLACLRAAAAAASPIYSGQRRGSPGRCGRRPMEHRNAEFETPSALWAATAGVVRVPTAAFPRPTRMEWAASQAPPRRPSRYRAAGLQRADAAAWLAEVEWTYDAPCRPDGMLTEVCRPAMMRGRGLRGGGEGGGAVVADSDARSDAWSCGGHGGWGDAGESLERDGGTPRAAECLDGGAGAAGWGSCQGLYSLSGRCVCGPGGAVS